MQDRLGAKCFAHFRKVGIDRISRANGGTLIRFRAANWKYRLPAGPVFSIDFIAAGEALCVSCRFKSGTDSCIRGPMGFNVFGFERVFTTEPDAPVRKILVTDRQSDLQSSVAPLAATLRSTDIVLHGS